MDVCDREPPPFKEIDPDHSVACYLY